MKKLVLVALMLCLGCMVSTKAQAVDGFVSGELQAYTNNGYRNFEGNVEVGWAGFLLALVPGLLLDLFRGRAAPGALLRRETIPRCRPVLLCGCGRRRQWSRRIPCRRRSCRSWPP